MTPDSLREGTKHRVSWITRRLALGAFATEARAQYLLAHGVTHILNVGEGASVIRAQPGGFIQVIDYPIADLARIPDAAALECLDILHEMLQAPAGKVYVHCIAGQNRSPTVLWLFLIACGLAPSEAKRRIEDRTPDAVPGHSLLIDEALVQLVQAHGAAHFLPLCDPQILAAEPCG